MIGISMDDDCPLGCLFVIQPRKQQGFADESTSLGMMKDSALDRMDFIHGSFDIIISLRKSGKEYWQQQFE
jgi:hypothetical protein